MHGKRILLALAALGSLRLDFVVAPGADPSRILLDIEAEVPLSLDPEGNLMLGGELFQPAPQIYQETSRGRQLVQGGFQLLGPSQVAFQLGPYDPGRPLVIDPLVYGTFLRGDRPQRPSAVAADPSTRHVAVTGSCVEPKEEDDDEDADVFVSKFDANGVLLYSTHFGGDEGESGLDIALDSTGQATITGGTGSLNFPIKGGLPNLTCRETDAFVTRLNPDGTDFVYSTLLGGEDDDRGVALALRPDGGVIVAGQTYSAKFPATPGAFQTVPASPPGGRQLDGFVAQLNTTGDRLLYATYLGGSEADFLQALAVDAEGNAAVTCMTHSEDFPTAGPLSTRLTGLHNAFVSRLDSEGKMLIYSRYLGGSGADAADGLSQTASGEVVVVGTTSSTDFPVTAGVIGPHPAGEADVFVSRIPSDGGELLFSTYLGGEYNDEGNRAREHGQRRDVLGRNPGRDAHDQHR
jgi:hypothetical protein